MFPAVEVSENLSELTYGMVVLLPDGKPLTYVNVFRLNEGTRQNESLVRFTLTEEQTEWFVEDLRNIVIDWDDREKAMQKRGER